MTKEHYTLSSNQDLSLLENELNVILQRIAERLDQIEGEIGTATIKDKAQIVDGDGNILHGFNVRAL